MFIDTHCHLTDEYDGGAVVSRAKNVGVGAMICATAEGVDIKPAIKIADKYDNIFVTAGIHPDHFNLDPNDFLRDDVLNNPRVVGIGEIGLDYHFGTQNRNAQIELFEKQIEIAIEHDLPIAIHTRDAEDDTITILNKYPKVHGVMHCFTSNWELAKYALNRGFYFSASGILTFKNSESVRETFAKIPNDRIVIETDSPYCAPVPYRGKVCEPAFVIETARILAQIKNLQIEELEKILYENTLKLYQRISLA